MSISIACSSVHYCTKWKYSHMFSMYPVLFNTIIAFYRSKLTLIYCTLLTQLLRGYAFCGKCFIQVKGIRIQSGLFVVIPIFRLYSARIFQPSFQMVIWFQTVFYMRILNSEIRCSNQHSAAFLRVFDTFFDTLIEWINNDNLFGHSVHNVHVHCTCTVLLQDQRSFASYMKTQNL